MTEARASRCADEVRTRWGVDDFSLATGLAVLTSGALYYGLPFWLYLAGLRRTSAASAGSFLTLIPVFGLAAAATTGHTLGTAQWVGVVAVLAAMTWLVNLP